ncbi:unnamed protein product [Brassica rapa subsp. trilocularis]|uniref:(rape) hypothetical protein n=1 Tax=Brassica napus TaxID=3708 RepID=A0A078I6R3_BRANA|nr:unnamed protein product [Brassica napus]CAF2368063.1 unnamed protein product [Brassica napus]CDY45094.1 BnaA02g04820D [Brassica napus]
MELSGPRITDDKPSDPIVQRLCSLDFINNGGWVHNLPIVFD